MAMSEPSTQTESPVEGGGRVSFLQKNIALIRLGEVAIIVGLAAAAWTTGGDMFIALPLLAAALAVSLLGVWGTGAGNLLKSILSVLVVIFFASEGELLNWHFHGLFWPSWEADDVIAGSVFVETHPLSLPEVYPADGKIEVLYLTAQVLAPTAQSSLVIATDIGTPGVKINWPKAASGFLLGTLFEITNDTSIPLTELTIPFRISYGARSNNRLIDKTLTITRLDPGHANRRAFYVVNQTPEGGAVTLGAYVGSATKDGDQVVRRIHITVPTSLIPQIALFMPFVAAPEGASSPKKRP
jgi:hypothetical protein